MRRRLSLAGLRFGLALLITLASRIAGQAQAPVYFLPGLAESPGIWNTSGPSLAATYNITASYPYLPSTDRLVTQWNSLGTVPTTAYLVGHSNGGLVARYAAQQQSVAGVITFGTPNFGAPIVNLFPDFCFFLGGTTYDFLSALVAIDPATDQWIVDEIEPNADWVVELFSATCDGLATALAGLGTDAAADDAGNSAFINSLDDPDHIATEQAHAGTEVSVVVTTDDWLDAGWLKALLPDSYGTAESWGQIVQWTGVTLNGIAAYLQLNYPDDWHYMDLSEHFFDVGEDLLFADQAWCQVVTGYLYFCPANDELIPQWSQDSGHGQTVFVGAAVVHQREAQDGSTLLAPGFDAAGLGRR